VFTLLLGTENAGKRMFAFVRWANTSEPHKSSPWTQLLTIVLSD
jgi:hypothetical protein